MQDIAITPPKDLLSHQLAHESPYQPAGHAYHPELVDFCNDMQIPLSGPKESYKTIGRYNLFISRYGCTIYISRQHKNINHPRALKPLFSKRTGELCFNLYAGLKPLPEYKTEKELFALFEKEGLDYQTWTVKYNCGEIPGTGYIVIFDIKPDRFKIDETAIRILTSADPDWDSHIQEKFYRELIDLWNAAWPEARGHPDPALIKECWKTHRTWKAQGKLLSPWDRYNYAGSAFAARNYEAHCRRLDKEARYRIWARNFQPENLYPEIPNLDL
jgi:hypothetical protein